MTKLEVIEYLKALKTKIHYYHMKTINEIHTENPNNFKQMIRTEENMMEQEQKINDVISLIDSFSEEEK